MSISAQADDAATLIAELGFAPAVVFGTSGGGNILLDLIARRPGVVRGAVVHEPALIALAEDGDAGGDELGPIIELAGGDPRGAMEAFLRMVMSDATFESLDPELRERILGNGAHFFAEELGAFGSYLPDVERIRAAAVPMRLLVGGEGDPDGTPQLAQVTARLAEQLGIEAGSVSGHHAPYLQHPEAFAEELRPILQELV